MVLLFELNEFNEINVNIITHYSYYPKLDLFLKESSNCEVSETNTFTSSSTYHIAVTCCWIKTILHQLTSQIENTIMN